jgi:hypothetical protein
MVEVAAEKNSTLVLPFPVEMLRFFEAAAQGGALPKPSATEAELPPVPKVAPEPLLRTNGTAAAAPAPEREESDPA